jgi:hypothetical protein
MEDVAVWKAERKNNCGEGMMAASEYPKSLFNKGVRTQDEEHIGHVMKETGDKIVIFGERGFRFDVPKPAIIAIGRNVILGMDYDEIFRYKVARDGPLPVAG